jgi:hypothetical protein
VSACVSTLLKIMFVHVTRAEHVFACVGTYQELSVSVHICTCRKLGLICMSWPVLRADRVSFMCWLVLNAERVFPNVFTHPYVFARIGSLTCICTHLHVMTTESAPECVGPHRKLGIYVDMLARIKRQACFCACLHVLKLATHMHLWRAGHVSQCI